jgi:multidrug efflux pump subunit AcrA (membrane-fusion protein)
MAVSTTPVLPVPAPPPRAGAELTPSAAVDHELARLRLYSPTVLASGRGPRTFFKWLMGIAAAGVIALFLPWQQNVQGTGAVTALRPQDRPQTLPSAIDGQIQEWFVREGEFVRKGQPIVRISEIKDDYLDPNVVGNTASQRDAKAAAIQSKRAAAAALAQQARVLRQGMALKLDQTRNKILQYEADVRAGIADSAVAADQLRRRQALASEGLASTNDLQSALLKSQKASADLAEKRAGLANAGLDLGTVEADYNKEIVKAQADRAKTLADANDSEAEVAKLDNKVASLEARTNFRVIRAPQDGYVVQAQQAGLGQTVKAGDAIVTVQPAQPQQAAELYLRALDATIVRPGDPVRLQFDGWPALQFSGWPGVSVGTFGGRVAVVDRVATKDGKFRVLVVPDTADEPWPSQVRIGSGVYGWAMLREVRVWYELWRQLNGFPPTVAQTAADARGATDAKGGKDKAK